MLSCWHDLLKSFGVRPEGTPGVNHSRVPLAEVVLIKPDRCEGHDQTGRDPGQNSSAAFFTRFAHSHIFCHHSVPSSGAKVDFGNPFNKF